MIIECVCLVFVKIALKSEFLEFFQKPPGGTCQFSMFLGSLRNRLAVNPCIAKRHEPATQFLGFVMNCLAVMNTCQAT